MSIVRLFTLAVGLLSTSCTVLMGLMGDLSSTIPGSGGTSTVRSEARAADSTCAVGGIDVATGIDQDLDGSLDDSEVRSITTLCHAEDDVLALLDARPLDDPGRCPTGGFELLFGFDTDGNTELDAEELVRSEVICNGAPPNVGWVTLVLIDTIPDLDACPAGGIRLKSGLDRNRNLVLDDTEIQFDLHVCNGVDGPAGVDGTACFRSMIEGTDAYQIICDDGTGSWVAKGATGERGPSGPNGPPGKDGTRCWETPFVEPGYIKIVCEDGSEVLLTKGKKGSPGTDGPAGESGAIGFQCTAETSHNSSITEYTCTDGSTIIVKSGARGTRGPQGERGPTGQRGKLCSRQDSGQNDSILITCEDGTSATLKDGSPGATGPSGPAGDAGTDGTTCAAVRDDALQRTLIQCDDGSSSYVYDGDSLPGEKGETGDAGTDGEGCSAAAFAELGLYVLTCADQTTSVVRNGENGGTGPQGAPGEAGEPGRACDVLHDTELGAYQILCPDGTAATVYDGQDGNTGAPGPAGMDGLDGERCEAVEDSVSGNVWVFCEDGTQSAIHNGEDGATGNTADISLIRVWTESAGPRCPYGGLRFVAGTDQNGDGELQEEEVNEEEFVCTNSEESCAEGFHQEGGACASNTRACNMENGVGLETWENGTYGTCTLVSCNSGYHDGGSGNCVTEGVCSSGFLLREDGICDDFFSEAFIPFGSFERDGRTVVISRSMAMMTTEVTQGLWKAISGGINPAQFTDCDGLGGNSCPIEGMDWYATIGFANALSTFKGLSPCYEITGCDEDEWADGSASTCNIAFANPQDPLSCPGFRLPTEAEWEYAYRAGTTTEYYSGENDVWIPVIAWYENNAVGETHPVAQKQANAWGLFDMPGNVEEWIWDWHADYPEEAADYLGPDTGYSRVLRGGFYGSAANALSASNRSQMMPTFNNSAIGFRLTRTIP